MVTYQEKLEWVQQFVDDNVSSTEEFIHLFNITLEDLREAFLDKQVKAYKKLNPDNETYHEAEDEENE